MRSRHPPRVPKTASSCCVLVQSIPIIDGVILLFNLLILLSSRFHVKRWYRKINRPSPWFMMFTFEQAARLVEEEANRTPVYEDKPIVPRPWDSMTAADTFREVWLSENLLWVHSICTKQKSTTSIEQFVQHRLGAKGIVLLLTTRDCPRRNLHVCWPGSIYARGRWEKQRRYTDDFHWLPSWCIVS